MPILRTSEQEARAIAIAEEIKKLDNRRDKLTRELRELVYKPR